MKKISLHIDTQPMEQILHLLISLKTLISLLKVPLLIHLLSKKINNKSSLIVLPKDIFGNQRLNSEGINLADIRILMLLQQDLSELKTHMAIPPWSTAKRLRKLSIYYIQKYGTI
ncbi:MAG: hypothetical protein ACKE51_03075 [Methylococcaceae bacterium]